MARRFQFSLRALLITIALASTGIGILRLTFTATGRLPLEQRVIAYLFGFALAGASLAAALDPRGDAETACLPEPLPQHREPDPPFQAAGAREGDRAGADARPRYQVHGSFDGILESARLQVVKAAHRSRNTVAFVERFIQTLQQQCLDYFVVFGQAHMDYLCGEFAEHYHEERPHQAKDNDLLVVGKPAAKKKRKRKAKSEEHETIPFEPVQCRQRLGGLLKHYYRQAA